MSSPLISFRTTGPVLKKIKGHEIDRVTVQQTPFRAHVHDRTISNLFRNEEDDNKIILEEITYSIDKGSVVSKRVRNLF